MIGEPLDAVEDGVRSLLSALRRNPYALESVSISVITFDVKARVAIPLTEVGMFRPPSLSVKPGTSLGAALGLLRDSIERDLVKTTSETKGDFKPLVFILTDGQPTDDWKRQATLIRTTRPSMANIYSIGCGEEVNFEIMGQIADVCLRASDLSADAISKVFVWLSASVGSSSAKADDEPMLLANVPMADGLEVVDLAKPPNFAEKAWVYFHTVCTSSKKFFLARYRLDPKTKSYVAADAFPLPEDFFSEGTPQAPTISSSKIDGQVPCPFCGARYSFMCDKCKTLNCFSGKSSSKTVTCAKCGTVLRLNFVDAMDIGGSAG
jgi:uncharacterized protein YegL